MAVLHNQDVLASRSQAMTRGQSEALMPMIASVLNEAGVGWPDIALIGVTVGPGTFTGIRIGLAAARGLALAAGRPIAGVGTCEALAHGVAPEERRGRTVLVAVDSKRADLFVQAFDETLAPLGPPAGMPAAAACELVSGPLLLVGDAAVQLAALRSDAAISSAPVFPDARVVGRLAADRHAAGTALPAEPIYLRPPDVTLPVRPGLTQCGRADR